ncbi:MAG TPA: hypothetical protein DCY79_07580, partial [Planctomycetaceae bacterium]|nr:hypothetical protein [Planctomycetaceae bacterium]
SIARYRNVITQFDEKWPPENFPLPELLQASEQQMGGSEDVGLGTPGERNSTNAPSGTQGNADAADTDKEQPPEPAAPETSPEDPTANQSQTPVDKETNDTETPASEADSDQTPAVKPTENE